jgi:TolB-like protein
MFAKAQEEVMNSVQKIAILLIGLSLCLLGCAKTPVRGYIKADLAVSHITSIAVLPFDNVSGHPDAGKKVVNLFLTELVRTEIFKMADMGEVENLLRSLRVRTIAEIDLPKLQAFKERLSVQAVIVGSVDEYELRQERSGAVPIVAVNARMLDAQTGDILWAVSHTRDGDDWETVFGFGRIISLSRLAQIVISEVLESLTDELQKRAKAERRWQRARLK